MLFRPHEAKYLFGRKIPFTPGIIPKEKGRLAASIGTTISANLMNQEVLEKHLLSKEMKDKILDAVLRFIEKQKTNDETLREFLSHYLLPQEIDDIAKSGGNDLTELIYTKLATSDVGNDTAHLAVAHVMKKMQHFGSGLGDKLADEGIGHGGGFGDMISRGIDRLFGRSGTRFTSQFINSLADPVEKLLAKNINEMLQKNSREIVGNLISTEADNLLSCRVSHLLEDKDDDLLRAKQSIFSMYEKIIREQLPKILRAVDISKVVESRINEMDMNEVEKIIFEVIDKELKAIVWFGALLGFIIGWMNLLTR
jgi:uncharacterized membrane protein YheB (UPF0754 family)